MAEPILEIRNLTLSFASLRASDDISLDLCEGEIHALIGPNGAGKSTLIAQIAGAFRPDSGTIRFCGTDITALDRVSRVRLGLARSFQVSAILPEFTVLQNTMIARQGALGQSIRIWRKASADTALIDEARAALTEVGLTGREAVEAGALAHAERRKLELAMALALKPRVFLLDEPMAGMGLEGAAEMTALLDRLRQRAPILLVEHDMDAVFALADRITVLDYGRVLASGTAAEIRAHPEVRRAYLGEDHPA